MRNAMLGAALALAPTGVGAEVKSATAAGFEIENKVVVPVGPAEAYAALGRIGSWWNSSHT